MLTYLIGYVKKGGSVKKQEGGFIDMIKEIEEVMKIANQIAVKAPLAVYGCKKMINYARDHNTADGLDYVAIWNASMLKPEEILEAMNANSENREGNFTSLPKIKGT